MLQRPIESTLAINARDAMPDGGRLSINVSNTTLVTDSDDAVTGEYVTLKITDNGTGMSQDVLSHAYDPFFTTKQQGKGTGLGLGLSMVYGFVKQSDGYINIESHVGEGTIVQIHLPRHQGLLDPIDLDTEIDQDKNTGESILLVEDDHDLLEMASQLLTNLGYRVHEAGDGIAALEILAGDGAVDLILTDVVLPKGMSGPDLATRAQAIFPDIKILYMSGYNEHPAIVRHEGKNPPPLISKPFRKAELADGIRAVLDRPH